MSVCAACHDCGWGEENALGEAGGEVCASGECSPFFCVGGVVAVDLNNLVRFIELACSNVEIMEGLPVFENRNTP